MIHAFSCKTAMKAKSRSALHLHRSEAEAQGMEVWLDIRTGRRFALHGTWQNGTLYLLGKTMIPKAEAEVSTTV